MMLTRFASALSGLLGLRGGGHSPVQLSDMLACTLDAMQFFYAGYSEVLTVADQAVTAGEGAFLPVGTFTVPAGEAWWCMEYGVHTITDATGTIANLTVALFFNGDTNHGMNIGKESEANVLINQRRSRMMDRPRMLLPGDVLGYIANNVTATSQIMATARIIRMKL